MSLQIGSRYDFTRVSLGMYPDNTPVVDLETVWNKYAHTARLTMISRPDSLHEFVTHMMVADSFAERGRSINSLVIPRIPGARQDRLKWEGDWLFTLKSVAKMINDRQFDKVVTLDPHSLATTALIDRVFVPQLNYGHLFGETGLAVPDGIIVPDLGAQSRAAEVARQLDVPLYQAGKTRDPQTNKLSGFKFYDTLIPDQRYLVVDDLCDAGGTFIGLAEEAHKVYGVTLDLFVTHGLFTKGTSTLLRHYESIYATDSVEINDERVAVMPATEGMALYV